MRRTAVQWGWPKRGWPLFWTRCEYREVDGPGNVWECKRSWRHLGKHRLKQTRWAFNPDYEWSRDGIRIRKASGATGWLTREMIIDPEEVADV